MRLSRRQAWLLVGAAAWTWYVWVTRIWNILFVGAGPAHDFGFKAVHTALAIVSIALLTPVGLLGIKALRSPRTSTSGTPDTRERVTAPRP